MVLELEWLVKAAEEFWRAEEEKKEARFPLKTKEVLFLSRKAAI